MNHGANSVYFCKQYGSIKKPAKQTQYFAHDLNLSTTVVTAFIT